MSLGTSSAETRLDPLQHLRRWCGVLLNFALYQGHGRNSRFVRRKALSHVTRVVLRQATNEIFSRRSRCPPWPNKTATQRGECWEQAKRRDRQHLVRSQHTQGQGGPVPSGMAPPPKPYRRPLPWTFTLVRRCRTPLHHHLHGPSQRIAGRICTLRGPQLSTGQVRRKWVLLPWLPRICDGTERTTRGVLGVECRGHPSLLCCDMQVRKRNHPTPVSSWDCAT
jgi:hypothetical protein